MNLWRVSISLPPTFDFVAFWSIRNRLLWTPLPDLALKPRWEPDCGYPVIWASTRSPSIEYSFADRLMVTLFSIKECKDELCSSTWVSNGVEPRLGCHSIKLSSAEIDDAVEPSSSSRSFEDVGNDAPRRFFRTAICLGNTTHCLTSSSSFGECEWP